MEAIEELKEVSLGQEGARTKVGCTLDPLEWQSLADLFSAHKCDFAFHTSNMLGIKLDIGIYKIQVNPNHLSI